MRNHIFSDESLSVLSSISEWRIAATGLDTEFEKVEDEEYMDWLQENSESHPYQEMLFVLHGESLFGFNGEVYRTKPGDVFMLDEFEPHSSFYPPWSPDLLHLWIVLFQDRTVINIIAMSGGLLSKENTILMPKSITATWQHGLFTHKKYPSYMPIARKLRAYAEVATAISSIIQIGHLERHTDISEPFSDQIIALLEQHIRAVNGASIKLENLARISGYSKFYLSRLFKERMGKTLHQYANECKISAVIQMQSEGINKKEIANTLGFSCPAAFSRWYRQNILEED